jgi:glycosyltransferase involved in cell wall biosynthesis
VAPFALSTANKTVRVCILTSVHKVFDVRIFHKEAKALAMAAYDVTLIAQHTKDKKVDGIHIIAVSEAINRVDRIIRVCFQILKLALKQRADIYHFHDPELLPVGVLLKVSGKKVIYDVHEDLPEQIMSKYYIPHWQRKPMAVLAGLIEKTVSNMFDYIITATDSIKEKFKSHTNVVSIGNFPIIDLDKGYNRNIDREKKNSSIIYVGGLTEDRGIGQVVSALEYLPNSVELILLGEFSPKTYEDEVRRLKGFEKVRYLGLVDFKEVNKYLSGADTGIVCLQPINRYKISFPTKLFEYMEAGLPVVASNFALWRDIIDTSNCGICVDPTNPEEISEAIKNLLENPEKARQMGENGRRAVFESYNWGNESRKLLGVYRDLSD